MAPPNTVAIASPIPTHYFGQAYGSAAAYPASFQFHGMAQPNIATMHPDISTILPVMPGGTHQVAPIIGRVPVQQRVGDIVNNWGEMNPLSWWRRQIASRGYGRWLAWQ